MTCTDFEMERRLPRAALRRHVTCIAGYRERRGGAVAQRETASLTVPLILSFGTPFRIGLGRPPAHDDAQPSFAAGLFTGPVLIESDGKAQCLQIDFTPPGAFWFFGGAVADLTERMMPLDLLLGAEGRRLTERMAETSGWPARFDIAETFLERRLADRGPASPTIEVAYRALTAPTCVPTVSALATEIGWSRKHLVRRFTAEIGINPKSVARIARFNRACTAARRPGADGWAGIAADCGYADQSHLIREFASLAGETPVAWAKRLALTDPRLLRD